jgi:hypothetical protein
MLISATPGNVLHEKNGRAPIDLTAALNAAQSVTFIIQPQIEPEDFRDFAFANLGLPTEAKSHVPPLSGLRPDVLYLGEPGSATYEILPDGARQRVVNGDQRKPISVIDLKN